MKIESITIVKGSNYIVAASDKKFFVTIEVSSEDNTYKCPNFILHAPGGVTRTTAGFFHLYSMLVPIYNKHGISNETRAKIACALDDVILELRG